MKRLADPVNAAVLLLSSALVLTGALLLVRYANPAEPEAPVKPPIGRVAEFRYPQQKERADQAVARLKQLLLKPDTMRVLHTLKHDFGKHYTSLEVQFQAEGEDGELHDSIFHRYFFPDGREEDGFPRHKLSEEFILHDPHKLFRDDLDLQGQ